MKTFIVSDESVNEYGYRVLTAGIKTDRFLSNPVMFYNHERSLGVIGKWANLKKQDNGQMIADSNFDTADADLGRKIDGKVERGFIKAASIGIHIIAISTDPTLMLPGQTLPTVTECELLEISVVDLPGNANALTLYDENGEAISIPTSHELKLFFEHNKVPMLKLTAKTITALSIAESASPEQIEVAVQAILSRADNAEKELKELREKAKEESKKRALSLVESAVSEKKITAGEKDTFVELALTNFDLAEKTLAKLKAPNLPSAGIKPDTRAGANGQTLRELAGGKGLRELEKKTPKLAARIRKEDEDFYKELYFDEYGVEPKL